MGPDGLLNLDPAQLAVVALRTTVVYLVLVAVLHGAGKRELGQLTLPDMVALLVISNAVQNAMIGPDTSLTAGLVAALTLVVLNRLVDILMRRSPWLRRQLVGAPTLLVRDGQLVFPALAREGITEDEVIQALREHGISDLAEVVMAVLEVDGTISIVPASAEVQRTRRRLPRRMPGNRSTAG